MDSNYIDTINSDGTVTRTTTTQVFTAEFYKRILERNKDSITRLQDQLVQTQAECDKMEISTKEIDRIAILRTPQVDLTLK